MAKSPKTIVFESLLFPKKFIEGRLKKSNKTLETLKAGEGAVLTLKGKKVAVYKYIGGKTETLSPVCKHLGCNVDWNNEEKTWDCPCHGSRYRSDGTVFNGPSKKNLDKVEISG